VEAVSGAAGIGPRRLKWLSVNAFMSAINTGGSSSSVGWRTKVAKARELERRLASHRGHTRTRARCLRRRALRRRLTPAGAVCRLQSLPQRTNNPSLPVQVLTTVAAAAPARPSRGDLDLIFVVDTGALMA
jgi:hypothetical protein